MTTKAAFELWQAGRLEEAAACYREALDAMPADDDGGARPTASSPPSCRASAITRAPSTISRLRSNGARRVAGSDAPLAVVITRYFLADHLRRQGRAEEALAAIAPSLDVGAEKAWLLYVVEAEALLALGRREYAAVAAERALALAPSDEKRAELAARFAAAGLA